MPDEHRSSNTGAIIVSIAVLSTFAIVMATVMIRGVPSGDTTVVVGLVENLKAMSYAVVGYWVGSSISAKRSGDILRSLAQKSTTPTAPEEGER